MASLPIESAVESDVVGRRRRGAPDARPRRDHRPPWRRDSPGVARTLSRAPRRLGRDSSRAASRRSKVDPVETIE